MVRAVMLRGADKVTPFKEPVKESMAAPTGYRPVLETTTGEPNGNYYNSNKIGVVPSNPYHGAIKEASLAGFKGVSRVQHETIYSKYLELQQGIYGWVLPDPMFKEYNNYLEGMIDETEKKKEEFTQLAREHQEKSQEYIQKIGGAPGAATNILAGLATYGSNPNNLVMDAAASYIFGPVKGLKAMQGLKAAGIKGRIMYELLESLPQAATSGLVMGASQEKILDDDFKLTPKTGVEMVVQDLVFENGLKVMGKAGKRTYKALKEYKAGQAIPNVKPFENDIAAEIVGQVRAREDVTGIKTGTMEESFKINGETLGVMAEEEERIMRDIIKVSDGEYIRSSEEIAEQVLKAEREEVRSRAGRLFEIQHWKDLKEKLVNAGADKIPEKVRHLESASGNLKANKTAEIDKALNKAVLLESELDNLMSFYGELRGPDLAEGKKIRKDLQRQLKAVNKTLEGLGVEAEALDHMEGEVLNFFIDHGEDVNRMNRALADATGEKDYSIFSLLDDTELPEGLGDYLYPEKLEDVKIEIRASRDEFDLGVLDEFEQRVKKADYITTEAKKKASDRATARKTVSKKGGYRKWINDIESHPRYSEEAKATRRSRAARAVEDSSKKSGYADWYRDVVEDLETKQNLKNRYKTALKKKMNTLEKKMEADREAAIKQRFKEFKHDSSHYTKSDLERYMSEAEGMPDGAEIVNIKGHIVKNYSRGKSGKRFFTRRLGEESFISILYKDRNGRLQLIDDATWHDGHIVIPGGSSFEPDLDAGELGETFKQYNKAIEIYSQLDEKIGELRDFYQEINTSQLETDPHQLAKEVFEPKEPTEVENVEYTLGDNTETPERVQAPEIIDIEEVYQSDFKEPEGVETPGKKPESVKKDLTEGFQERVNQLLSTDPDLVVRRNGKVVQLSTRRKIREALLTPEERMKYDQGSKNPTVDTSNLSDEEYFEAKDYFRAVKDKVWEIVEELADETIPDETTVNNTVKNIRDNLIPKTEPMELDNMRAQLEGNYRLKPKTLYSKSFDDFAKEQGYKLEDYTLNRGEKVESIMGGVGYGQPRTAREVGQGKAVLNRVAKKEQLRESLEAMYDQEIKNGNIEVEEFMEKVPLNEDLKQDQAFKRTLERRIARAEKNIPKVINTESISTEVNEKGYKKVENKNQYVKTQELKNGIKLVHTVGESKLYGSDEIIPVNRKEIVLPNGAKIIEGLQTDGKNYYEFEGDLSSLEELGFSPNTMRMDTGKVKEVIEKLAPGLENNLVNPQLELKMPTYNTKADIENMAEAYRELTGKDMFADLAGGIENFLEMDATSQLDLIEDAKTGLQFNLNIQKFAPEKQRMLERLYDNFEEFEKAHSSRLSSEAIQAMKQTIKDGAKTTAQAEKAIYRTFRTKHFIPFQERLGRARNHFDSLLTITSEKLGGRKSKYNVKKTLDLLEKEGGAKALTDFILFNKPLDGLSPELSQALLNYRFELDKKLRYLVKGNPTLSMRSAKLGMAFDKQAVFYKYLGENAGKYIDKHTGDLDYNKVLSSEEFTRSREMFAAEYSHLFEGETDLEKTKGALKFFSEIMESVKGKEDNLTNGTAVHSLGLLSPYMDGQSIKFDNLQTLVGDFKSDSREFFTKAKDRVSNAEALYTTFGYRPKQFIAGVYGQRTKYIKLDNPNFKSARKVAENQIFTTMEKHLGMKTYAAKTGVDKFLDHQKMMNSIGLGIFELGEFGRVAFSRTLKYGEPLPKIVGQSLLNVGRIFQASKKLPPEIQEKYLKTTGSIFTEFISDSSNDTAGVYAARMKKAGKFSRLRAAAEDTVGKFNLIEMMDKVGDVNAVFAGNQVMTNILENVSFDEIRKNQKYNHVRTIFQRLGIGPEEFEVMQMIKETDSYKKGDVFDLTQIKEILPEEEFAPAIRKLDEFQINLIEDLKFTRPNEELGAAFRSVDNRTARAFLEMALFYKKTMLGAAEKTVNDVMEAYRLNGITGFDYKNLEMHGRLAAGVTMLGLASYANEAYRNTVVDVLEDGEYDGDLEISARKILQATVDSSGVYTLYGSGGAPSRILKGFAEAPGRLTEGDYQPVIRTGFMAAGGGKLGKYAYNALFADKKRKRRRRRRRKKRS